MRMSRAGERSGDGLPMRNEQRDTPQVSRGTEEDWRGSGLKRGKNGFPNLGHTPTEQGMDIIAPMEKVSLAAQWREEPRR